MTERKRLLYELGDAFIALPGGLGTLEETVEVMSWRNLELHSKPVALCNVESYYTHLYSFIKTTIDEEFTNKHVLDHFRLCPSAKECVAYLEEQMKQAERDKVGKGSEQQEDIKSEDGWKATEGDAASRPQSTWPIWK